MQARQRIHALSQELIKAQEIERQMISRELHDSIGQDLASLIIRCESLVDEHGRLPIEVKQSLCEFSRTLRNTVAAVRNLAYDLRPPGLDQLGLVRTISEYCDDFSGRSGLSVDFSSAGMDSLMLKPDLEINLYRLMQEGINNIGKHAAARKAVLRLVASYPKIILRIEDDGKGFDVDKRLKTMSNERRMGLGNMEERVSLLGGTMRIQSRPGKGTRIVIEVPVKEQGSGSEKEHIDRR
jgi:signal transduction histidine kinase